MLSLAKNPIYKPSLHQSKTLALTLFQQCMHVAVTMKWKKDPYFDSIDLLTKSKDLKILISLKNLILSLSPPQVGIPISSISKQNRRLEISGRVTAFLRKYPSFFEEFTGPKYNLPWFKLTHEAFELDREENTIYETKMGEIVDRLRRLVLMSRERILPFRIVQGMLWYLGLPDDFLKNQENLLKFGFEIFEIGDGEKWLKAPDTGQTLPLSALQRNAISESGEQLELLSRSDIHFPLFPSKGIRLKVKIRDWLDQFQKVPYVSPYEAFSDLELRSDVAEKRVAGVLHELLSIFVDNSAERRRLFCLRKHLGLPQKVDKVFEKHPHVFYLLLKNKTCFVVLKEAYQVNGQDTVIERHPLLKVRQKYVKLMMNSDTILRIRRSGKQVVELNEEDSSLI
ncbi:protein ROOT PRIMORDIUM DEFECTIVE 1 [Carex littledalei]|uniref:Protein ROOT PRIMORDIUM DEFECTIVE 1 n=1 Tax=Carex littledalei TaxID=544730 RepID=A0A833VP97_9POAL|nr:protein ROOT PRIMORDIUM DEFECTIVE 1 [Carex littledalei]